MRGIDDTDREILGILMEDARRPYSDIAESVDLSAPAVSDRVQRLRELGLIRRFTLDVDRSMLREGVPVLVELEVVPGELDGVKAGVEATEAVEHVFATADGAVVFTATVADGDVTGLLEGAVDLAALRDYGVRLLSDTTWRPSMGDADLASECAECGNTVTSEGESATLGGTVYTFCCSSCESRFVERYEQLRDDAGS